MIIIVPMSWTVELWIDNGLEFLGSACTSVYSCDRNNPNPPAVDWFRNAVRGSLTELWIDNGPEFKA